MKDLNEMYRLPAVMLFGATCSYIAVEWNTFTFFDYILGVSAGASALYVLAYAVKKALKAIKE